MPELTVGTLDNLVALSDDLVKISTQVEVNTTTTTATTTIIFLY